MKRVAAAVALAFVCLAGFAQRTASSYLGFLDEAERSALASTGEVTGFGSKATDLDIWQKAPFAEALRAVLPAGRSTIAAEGLFLVDLPAGATGRDLDRRVLAAFTAFSSMKGLQVYSASLRKMETFIYDSWRVDSLETKARLPDPYPDPAVRHVEYLMYQKEEQTGDVYSLMSVDLRDGYYLVTLNNLTELRWFFVSLVAPKELKTVFVVVPTEDKIVMYGITVANTLRLLGLENAKRSSFFYRMKSLEGWFAGNLARR
jgi:hypothetical protein